MHSPIVREAICDIAKRILDANIPGMEIDDGRLDPFEELTAAADLGRLEAGWRMLDGAAVDMKLQITPDPVPGRILTLRVNVVYGAATWTPSFAVLAARPLTAMATLAEQIERRWGDIEFVLAAVGGAPS